ncbi:MAG: sigma-70 family RNA polymerase sigma factor [Syntrophobacter sp.]
MTDPDLKLLRAAGQGDFQAFELLVKRYQAPLLNFIARYIGDRFLAEEAAQEVFLKVFRAAPRFEAKSKVSTWIFRIAYNQAMTEIDRRGRHRDLCQTLSNGREGEEPFSMPGEVSELRHDVMSALSRLPENQRAALLLRVNEELSYREIADILGVSVESVESLLFRARTNLKKYVDHR